MANREKFREEYRKLLTELVSLRKLAGITQEAVAIRLGIRQNVVSKYELGEVRLNVVEFTRYCRAIGADPAAILGKIDNF